MEFDGKPDATLPYHTSVAKRVASWRAERFFGEPSASLGEPSGLLASRAVYWRTERSIGEPSGVSRRVMYFVSTRRLTPLGSPSNCSDRSLQIRPIRHLDSVRRFESAARHHLAGHAFGRLGDRNVFQVRNHGLDRHRRRSRLDAVLSPRNRRHRLHARRYGAGQRQRRRTARLDPAVSAEWATRPDRLASAPFRKDDPRP